MYHESHEKRSNMRSRKAIFNIRFEIIIYLFIVTTSLAVYWPIRNHEFVNFDDDIYVYENRYVQGKLNLDNISWAFSLENKKDTHWHPLTWLSHMLDCRLYGLNPGMHHTTNLIFHIINSLLLFLVFKRMSGDLWQSGFIAVLFALHPISVDTVAWVAERKNVLSTFFWFITTLTYSYYTERPCLLRYLVCLLVFTFGLMAKPMLVTLPFTLLLLDYWPLGRFKSTIEKNDTEKSKVGSKCMKAISQTGKLIFEKVPFIALSLTTILISMRSQQRVVISTDSVPIKLRIANAIVSYIGYIKKMVWPTDLSVYYPFPDQIPIWEIIVAGSLLVFISILILQVLKQMPYLATGWFWFLGTLFPTIGLVQVSLWPAMADRWAYVPFIGLYIVIAWSIPWFLKKLRYRKIGLVLAVTVLFIILMIGTRLQVQHWRNSVSLFDNALKKTDNNYIAYNNLGSALIKQGKIDDAIKYLNAALPIHPYPARPYTNLGDAMVFMKLYDEAIEYYHKALRIDPYYMIAHNNLAIAFTAEGRLDEAIDHYQTALQISPNFDEIYNNLGVAFAARERFDDAINYFSMALKINPTYSEAYNNLGLVVIRKGMIEKAVLYFQEALRLKPGYADAQRNLNRALTDLKKIEDAVSGVRDALKINPHEKGADLKIKALTQKKMFLDKVIIQYWKLLPTKKGFTQIDMNHFVKVRAVKKEYEEALPIFKKITEQWPDCADAYYHIACIYSIQNQIEESVHWLQKAIEKGFNKLHYLESDSDLGNIRGSIYYNQLITGFKENTIKSQ